MIETRERGRNGKRGKTRRRKRFINDLGGL
jgi:hypothetical protein